MTGQELVEALREHGADIRSVEAWHENEEHYFHIGFELFDKKTGERLHDTRTATLAQGREIFDKLRRQAEENK